MTSLTACVAGLWLGGRGAVLGKVSRLIAVVALGNLGLAGLSLSLSAGLAGGAGGSGLLGRGSLLSLLVRATLERSLGLFIVTLHVLTGGASNVDGLETLVNLADLKLNGLSFTEGAESLSLR